MKKMKTNKISRPAVLLLTFITACTVQEKPGLDETSSRAISVVANTQEPATKTTLGGPDGIETQWVANTDKIGLFSPEAKTTQGGTPEANPAKNLGFTAQTASTNSKFTGSMYWGGSGNHNFYAYYPYNSEYTGDQTAVPISLPSSQIQSEAGSSAHIGALDFMVAKPLSVPYNEAVSMNFKHVFSMVEFRIKGSGTLSQLSLSGANPLSGKGTINLAQAAPAKGIPYSITTSSTSKYVTVNLETPVELSFSTTVIYMMVLPGTQSDLLIALNIDGEWRELSKDQPDGGFMRGNKYVVVLNTVTDTGLSYNLLEDSRDGNLYNYKTIGTQVWMTKNLKYLPIVVDASTGSEDVGHEAEPYYYVYGYDGTNEDAARRTDNYATCGVLYNWTAALTACPTGWHLPGDSEWTTLTNYLGGSSTAAGKMKATGTIEAGSGLWKNPNTSATNESGFNALPCGYRSIDQNFVYSGYNGIWWSSTEYDTSYARYRNVVNDNSSVNNYSFYYKFSGFSVRCVRNKII